MKWATPIEDSIEAGFRGEKRQVKHALLCDLIDRYNDETPIRGLTTMAQRQNWKEHFGDQKLANTDKEFGRRIIKFYTANGAQSPHAIKILGGIARVIKWGRSVKNLDISEASLLQVSDDMKYSGFAIRYESRKTIREPPLTYRTTAQQD